MSKNAQYGKESGLYSQMSEKDPSKPISLLKAHENLSLLDSDFQNAIVSLQATHQSTVSQISLLNAPVDDLISLFESFKSPSKSGLGIESTLHILTTLMARYDNTLAVLYRTREITKAIDKGEANTLGNVNEWRCKITNVVREVREVLTKQNEAAIERDGHLETLKARLTKVEEEKIVNEKLVLNLVSKLNIAEENADVYKGEIKALQLKVGSLKTQMAGISKWREHMQGLGVAKELRTGTAGGASTRQRALDYSRRNDAKVKFAGTTGSSPGSESRTQSRPTTAVSKTKASTPKAISAVNDKTASQTATGKEQKHDTQILGSLLAALNLNQHSGHVQSKSYPAESILFSKLSDIDSQIDLYLRDFHK